MTTRTWPNDWLYRDRSEPVVVNVTVEPALADKHTACRILAGISLRSLMQLVAEGRLNARKLGSRTVFEVDELRRFAASLPSWEPKDVPM
jgi:hypothetical protein